MSEQVVCTNLRYCDVHMARGETNVVARYDAKTVLGPWANMCEPCYQQYAATPGQLGTGRGQRLVYEGVDDPRRRRRWASTRMSDGK